ncbi:hypothetical protein JRC04_16835 [Mycolicibacterium sp. S2-37]|uniref:hypothetical protein n=1 Tax=Mycolicibacterium sp. S2-37 TaxID=2810297 RepID=UPI001A948DF5|nr:hypothetical protein [Mycolicibacterium sp. S2-37]MBO0679132.1 hypothetical protein [Mycolicibacterium sp. S2-37]
MSAADVLEWMWQRHHNVLSWYIRPLFLLPLAWFSYRRSGAGIAVTLATSMFWFPAPATVDSKVEHFLAFEQEWLTGGWTAAKIGLTLLVPASLTAFCVAFWKRSLLWGAVLLNVIAVGKLVWGVTAGSGTGWAMTVPALSGLLLGDIALLAVAQHRRKRMPAERANR